MKKYITIPVLATVTLLLAIGIVVACTKENTNKTTTTEAPSSGTKDLTPSQELAAVVFSFWQNCDAAYRDDPSNFLYICNNEDFDSFYDMVVDSEDMIETIGSLATSVVEGGYLPTGVSPVCVPCNTSLKQFGENVAALRSVINEIKYYNDSDTIPCFTPSSIDSCIILCHTTFGYGMNDEDAWCLLNCSISKELDRMSRHLAAVKADE